MDKNKDLSTKMLDITAKVTNSTSTKKAANTTNSTKNTTLKGGQGKFIDNLVKDIVGKETNPLKKAKAIYNAFKKHTYYTELINKLCSKHSIIRYNQLIV